MAVNSADSDMILQDCNDSATILEGDGVPNEPEVFDYSAVDDAMSNAGRKWGQVDDYESGEDGPQCEDIGVDEDKTESEMEGEDEGIGLSGLHISDELGESLERALATMGELVH
jgi:hypothetical protein